MVIINLDASSRDKYFARAMKLVDEYVVRWIKNPDPGSKFERNTRLIRWLPGFVLLALMRMKGYSGVVAFDAIAGIVGHVFYHKHADGAVHVFSVFVRKDMRGRGIPIDMLRCVVTYQMREVDTLHLRLGAGGEAWKKGLRHSYERILSGETLLTQEYNVFGGPSLGWLHFARHEPAFNVLQAA